MTDQHHEHDRDKVIADSGWGIKPDDQPARAADEAVRQYRYDPTDPDAVRLITQTQRRNFNTANRVIIEPGRTTIVDINGDTFVVEGLSYGDDNLVALLKALGAAFNPKALRELGPDYAERREYDLSRVWAWGAERTG